MKTKQNMEKISEQNIKPQTNQPITKFRSGQITATIWEHEQKKDDGTTYKTYTTAIEKNYKDKDGAWQKTSSYQRNDLIRVKTVLDKSINFLYLNEEEE